MSGIETLQRIAEQAKAKFAQLPFPERKNEYWRFGAKEAWGVDALFPFFQNSAERTDADAEMREMEKSLNAADSLVLFDGQPIFAQLPAGARLLSMAEAAEEFPENISKFYDERDSQKFSVLQSSRPTLGAYIKIESGAKVRMNLGIISKLGISTSGVVFDVSEGAQLYLNRRHLTFGGAMATAKTAFFMGKASELRSACVKFSEKNSRSYERETFEISEGATVSDALAQVGKSHSRHERNFVVVGGNVSVDTRMFVMPTQDITHDLRTAQMHIEANSKSNLAVKAALFDSAKLAFSGVIDVKEGAQKTQTYQSCKSLLLSKEAEAQASPILEICANDVACSHGCTVAEPDVNELFYMRQRGLTLNSALKLMVRSFAESSFEGIGDAEMAEKAMAEIFR